MQTYRNTQTRACIDIHIHTHTYMIHVQLYTDIYMHYTHARVHTHLFNESTYYACKVNPNQATYITFLTVTVRLLKV